MLNSFYDKFIFTNGLRYKHNNFFLGSLPFVIAPSELFVGLLETGDEEFERKLYYITKDTVKKRLLRRFGLDFGFEGEKLINFLKAYFVASGWGGIETIDFSFEGKRAILKVGNTPFSSMLHKKVSEPCDHLLRGIFAGVFTKAFKSSVDCVEVKCVAVGAPECEFIVKQREEFNIKSKYVRRQLGLDI
jgi:predicted hydrocarbon binding protein